MIAEAGKAWFKESKEKAKKVSKEKENVCINQPIFAHGACNSHCLCCGTAFRESRNRIVKALAALVVQNKVLVVVAATCSGCNTGERQFTYGGQAVAIAEAGKAWFGAMMNTGTVAKKAYVTEMERLDNDFEVTIRGWF